MDRVIREFGRLKAEEYERRHMGESVKLALRGREAGRLRRNGLIEFPPGAVNTRSS